MSEPLGRVNVEIGANVDALKKGVREAQTETAKVGAASQKAGKQTEEAFNKAGAAIESKTAGIRKFSGALSSVVGSVTGMVAVVGTLTAAITFLKRKQDEQVEATKRQRRAFGDLQAQVQEFSTESIASVKDLNKEFLALARAIDDNKELTRKQQDDLYNALKSDRDAREREVLRAEREAVIKVESERRRVMVEQSRQTRQAMDEALLGLSDAWIPDEEMIVARYEQLRRKLLQAVEQGISDPAQVDEYMKRIEETVARRQEADRQAFRERMAEEEKAETEKAQRVAKASADAYEREMSAAIDRIKSKIGPVFGDTNQLAAAIDRVANTIYGTRGGR